MMFDMAPKVVQWTELYSVILSAQYTLGKKNVLVDQLSHPDQWSLLPRVFEVVYKVFSCPHLDLFATRANTNLHVSSFGPDCVEAGRFPAFLGQC